MQELVATVNIRYNRINGATIGESSQNQSRNISGCSNVRDYQTQFENLLIQVGRLAPAQQVGCFVSSLKDNIKIDIQASTPTSLSSAIGLARLYEARNKSSQWVTSSEVRRTVPNHSMALTLSHMPIKKLSLVELREIREKGLCFNCNEKFGPEHQCKKLFLIEGCWFDGDDDDVDMEVEEVNTPEVSIHTIYGAVALQTMKVHARLVRCRIIILVDSRCTYNFLNNKIARRLGKHPNAEGKFEVAVANREKLPSSGLCKGICVTIQGAQWLRMLGPTVWDFPKLQMQFNLNGKEIILKGLATSVDKVVDAS
ncbi:hypothetical protein Patl1_32190 [Pistacia atlantica]|uniref:Uncharacterized protein n=1 Tax=Pistacia atlantica TaxID=434234 RepID=A0ACC1ARI8_9ROSI|nr:hypothetical protein Patl1_32190 [Pistacia atlantica]